LRFFISSFVNCNGSICEVTAAAAAAGDTIISTIVFFWGFLGISIGTSDLEKA